MAFHSIRRTLWLVLCIGLLVSGSALAAQPSDEFYNKGRNALLLLAQGDVDGALELIAFQFPAEDPTYSEEGFRQTVEEKYAAVLDENAAIQTTAVAFYMDELWYLALPVIEPVSDEVESFVLVSPDQLTFTGYAALSWSAVLEMSNMAEESYWNVEYKPDCATPIADE